MKFNLRTFVYLVSVTAAFSVQFEGILAKQEFEEEPTYTEVNPGEEAVLKCKIRNKGGDCSWLQEKHSVKINASDGRYFWVNGSIGDCSIKIKSATFRHDNGKWMCMVSAATSTSGDFLNSNEAILLVREKPDKLILLQNETAFTLNDNVITGQHGKISQFRCESHNGNPPANLSWFIDDEELGPVGRKQNHHSRNKMFDQKYQINQTYTQPDGNSTTKLLTTESILKNFMFEKRYNGKSLKCVARHPLLAKKELSSDSAVSVILDVQYAPEVRFASLPIKDLQEKKDNLTLECKVDANPSADVFWKKPGEIEFQQTELVMLSPVHRDHSGMYFCKAKNKIGISEEIHVKIDVKYPPNVLALDPPDSNMVSLYQNSTGLRCTAEGNPSPTYKWSQYTFSNEFIRFRGNEPGLIIKNITYEDQGRYACEVTNKINGKPYSVKSDFIEQTIIGAPQILGQYVDSMIEVEKGSHANWKILFCSNPTYNKVVWEWGSFQLNPGMKSGRFTANLVANTSRKNCYKAEFKINSVDHADSYHYYLIVENNFGYDKFSVNLKVRDPVNKVIVLVCIIAYAVLLIGILMIVLYAFFAEKWCFSLGHRKYKLEASESKKEKKAGEFVSEKKRKDFPLDTKAELQYSHNPWVVRPATPIGPPGLHHPRPCRPRDDSFRRVRTQNDYAFRGRPYEEIVMDNSGINFSDLQVPKISNNGSMRRAINDSNDAGCSQQLFSPNRPRAAPAPALPILSEIYDDKLFATLQEDEV